MDDDLPISVEFVDDETSPRLERVAVLISDQSASGEWPDEIEITLDQLKVMAEAALKEESRGRTIGTTSEALLEALHKGVLMEISNTGGSTWSDECQDESRPQDCVDPLPQAREMMWVDAPGDVPRQLALRYGGVIARPHESYSGNLIPPEGKAFVKRSSFTSIEDQATALEKASEVDHTATRDIIFTLEETMMSLVEAVIDEINKEDTPIPSASLMAGLNILSWASKVDPAKLARAELMTLLTPHYAFIEGDPRKQRAAKFTLS